MIDPRLKASILWGAIGALLFLVSVQGYELLVDRPVAATVKAGGALAVGTVLVATTRALRPRLPRNESS